MHGWVRLEVPCKADYDCGDMVGLYLAPPSHPLLVSVSEVSVWPLLTLAWSTHRACLLAALEVPSSCPCGRVQCAGVWMRAGCTCYRADSSTPPPSHGDP